MRKSDKRGMKQMMLSVISIIMIIVVTLSMALLGFHLASRYKATITELFDSVTEKISGIEDNIREEAENAVTVPEK